LRIEWQDPRAVGLVRFRVPYEGPPGCAHGGIIAATFDQLFNVANLMRGVAGPTRKLEVRYLKPTPLGIELRFEGWVERVMRLLDEGARPPDGKAEDGAARRRRSRATGDGT